MNAAPTVTSTTRRIEVSLDFTIVRQRRRLTMFLPSQPTYTGPMAAHLAGRLADPDRPALGDACPLDRAMQVVGTRSAALLMREAMYGTTRFDDFATRVGITDAIASARLKELVAAGLLERRPYREPGQRTRHEYALTPAGHDLLPVLAALLQWGREHLPRAGGPALSHAGCGADVTVELRCAEGHLVPEAELVVTGLGRTPTREPRDP